MIKEALITLSEAAKNGSTTASKALIELLRKEEQLKNKSSCRQIHINIVYNVLPAKPTEEPSFD